MSTTENDSYNQYVAEQRGLTEELNTALVTLFRALRRKEQVAKWQHDIRPPSPNDTPETLRWAYLHFITEQLERGNPERTHVDCQPFDWSCK